MAAVAAGAFAAAGATLDPAESSSGPSVSPLAADPDADLEADIYAGTPLGMGGAAPEHNPLRPQVLTIAKSDPTQLDRLTVGQQIHTERAAAAAEAARPKFVAPTYGRLTSSYGQRWGTMHWGVDIANSIGTPIRAAADGIVVESGPASGFGLWVRVEHADGTSTIYGHIDRTLVYEGQRVKAGDQIATMGNRGHSTGPHLHFEVWTSGGQKIDPIGWLNSHGVGI